MTSQPIRLVIADDHPLFREGVVRSLREAGGFEVAAEAASGPEAIAAIGSQKPDLALLDISMPGSGLVAAAEITERFPDVRVVMLTASEASDDVMAALRAGASGFVLKGIGSAALAEILRGVMDGASYVPPALAARLLVETRHAGSEDDPLASLSARETEVLRLVSTGLSNKEVALRLDLMEKTVKHHMTSILGKLRVRNRTEAALLIRERRSSGK